MPLQSPKRLDLSTWNSRVSNDVWEIFTPEKNSLYWSIILPYLIPPARSKDNVEFDKRLKILADDIKVSKAMDQMKNFNTFKTKHAFHFGEPMMSVLQKFKKKLNQNTKHRPKGVDVQHLKLAAASNMLNYFIELYRTDSTGEIENCHLYSPEAQSNRTDANTIVIFLHPDTQLKNRIIDTFGFGLTFESSVPLQAKALTFILRKDKYLKENNAAIHQAVRNRENFLTSLLNSNAKNAIPVIYRSPYILAKLRNAGFNTDPLVKDRNGLSAFYYCINLPDPLYLNILYDYVSNNYYLSEESCRKPGDQVVKALNDLKCAFETDRDILNRNSSLANMAAHQYREILRFNDYQTNVVKIIRDQENTIEDTVSAILMNYLNYFYAVPDDEDIQFENYLTFYDYYEKLDSYTGILLFDRLIKVENKAYSDLVQPLFLMMMSNNYFPQKEHCHDVGSLVCCKGCAHRIIPFKYRRNLFTVLKEVLNKVSQKSSAGNKASPADMIIESIQSIPKDEFLLLRLKTSLEVATDVLVNDTKGILTIFRALQILGEALATSENFISGFLLSACIPFDIKMALKNIRNDISHCKPNVIQGRLHLESNCDLFEKVQEDLKLILKKFQPVFSCQRFKMKEYIIQSATPLLPVSQDELNSIAIEREVWLEKHIEEFQDLAINVFKAFKKVREELFLKTEDSKKYAQKIKRIKDGSEAINLVFSINNKTSDPMVTNNISEVGDELQKIIGTVEKREPNDDDIKDFQSNFDKYVALLKQVFNIEFKDTNSEVNYENLIKLKENLRNCNVFLEDENLKVRKTISKFLEPSFEATMKLETALQNSQPLPDIDHILNKLHLTNKNKNKIKEYFSANRPENLETKRSQILKMLKEFSYNSQNEALGTESETTRKLLEMIAKDEYKKALLENSSIFENLSLETKFLKLVNQKMEFLIVKINWIENFLIDEDDQIRDLVKWGRSAEIKKHNKFLMRQRYVVEADIKLALQLLLFDCMNVMDKRKDLADIYNKMNDLFAGVDLRDILSHGNILVDSLGSILDPDDLPSEFINKMLELIDDRKTLRGLSEIWIQKKPTTTVELENLIKNDNLCKHFGNILENPRWKSYAILLPVRH